MADILTNSKARRDYHISEVYEAGIVLRGTEVKALRAGKGQIADAFARVEKDEVFLYNAHIDEYAYGNIQNHQPKAPRKLLMHKAEIRKLMGETAVKGTALADTLMTRRLAVAEVLLQAGADPNERASSPDGMTPLETARLMRDDDAVELLLRYGAIDEP